MTTAAMDARRGAKGAARRGNPSRRTPRELEVQAARIAVPRLWLIAAVCALTALGIVMVYSASSIKSLTAGGDAQAELVSQLVFTFGGVIVACLAARLFDYRAILEKSLPLVGVAAVLLLAVRVMGVASHGATRWISIAGVSLQPSELAKICVVLCMASGLAAVPRFRRSTDQDFLLKVGACVVTLLLIFFQPDKGTVMVCAIALWVMAVSDGYDGKKMLGIAALFVGAYLAYAMRDDYSRQRIISVFDPFADEYGDGYQSVHGFFAFASGGLLGRGLGMGVQKYAYLPEAHNDFILPVIGEELGFVGVLLVFLCFGIIAWAGVRIAQQANDQGGRLLAMGCVALLVGQAALNFAGVLGVAPLTGKAVPFLSAGGSSMLASMLIVGLLANVSLHTTLPETVHDRRRASLRAVEEVPAERRERRSAERPVAPASPFTLVVDHDDRKRPAASASRTERGAAPGSSPARASGNARNATLVDVSRDRGCRRPSLRQGA